MKKSELLRLVNELPDDQDIIISFQLKYHSDPTNYKITEVTSKEFVNIKRGGNSISGYTTKLVFKSSLPFYV